MTFQIHALPAAPFQRFFEPDVPGDHPPFRLLTADAKPGYPCRVSLRDAEIGERVLLIHHTHHAAPTPYRASHAIYVRHGAEDGTPAPGAVPAAFESRVLSLRGFGADRMMRAAEVVPGTALRAAIAAMFAQPDVAYAHIHFAGPGCFAARVTAAA